MTDKQRASSPLTQETERLHQQLVELEALASVGAMVPGVTHEINTPLGVSVTSLSFLRDELSEIQNIFQQGELTEQSLTDFLDSCDEVTTLLDKNLRRATRLVQSFKALAANQAVAEVSHFGLSELLQDVVNSLRHEVKRVVSDVSIQCSHELKLSSDAGALTQIISNLIMNSVRHGYSDSAPEPDKGKITVHCQTHDNWLTLDYQDNGKGINSDIQPRIFEPYFTTRKGQGGTGLGLCIVQELITDRLHGRIELISGATGVHFRLTLPMDIKEQHKQIN